MDAVVVMFQIIGALGAAGAAIAAAFVVYQGNKQLKETQESRYDSLRPLLVPQDMLRVRAHVGEQDVSGGSLETSEPGYDANAQYVVLPVKNVGPGVATSVTGVIFGPEPHAGEVARETGHSLRLGLPLEPGTTTKPNEWIQGGLMLTGNDMIAGYTLYASEKPSLGYQPHGRIPAIARLCLTYTDIFRRKHASIFDYTFDFKWVPIDFPRAIDADLMDLNFRRLAQIPHQ